MTTARCIARHPFTTSLAAIAASLAFGLAAPAHALIVSSNSGAVDGPPPMPRLCSPSYMTGPVNSLCKFAFYTVGADPTAKAIADLSEGGWRGLTDGSGGLGREGAVPTPVSPAEALAYHEASNVLDLLDVGFTNSGRDFTATFRLGYAGDMLFQVRYADVGGNGSTIVEYYLFQSLDASVGESFSFTGPQAGVAWVNVLTRSTVPLPATAALVLLGLAALAATRRRPRQAGRERSARCQGTASR